MKFSNTALRAEARENFRLALPLMIAQLAFVSMGTVDTLLAGRLGAREMAAVAVGSNLWFLFFVMFMGVCMAVSPIVAHRVGAAETPARTGGFVRRALGVAVFLGLVWFALMQLAMRPLLALLNLDLATETMAEDFMGALVWSTVPFCLGFVLRNVAEGHGLTRVPLLSALTGLVVNGVFGYLLMYGRIGLPPLGPEGCGWATVIAAWSMVGVYAILYPRQPALRRLQIWRRTYPAVPGETLEIFRLGLPIAAIVTAEASLFSIGALLMARFGPETVAAHQIAINFASLSFMVPLAIGFATAVRVGHAAGARDAAAVALRGRVGILMGAGFGVLAGSVMALFPGMIVALYTDVEVLHAQAVAFLFYAAVFQLFDCVQATSNGALRGIKDTRVPMFVTVFAYWAIGMPLALGLAYFTEVGPAGIWWGFIGGLVIAAVGLSSRFVRRTRVPRQVAVSI